MTGSQWASQRTATTPRRLVDMYRWIDAREAASEWQLSYDDGPIIENVTSTVNISSRKPAGRANAKKSAPGTEPETRKKRLSRKERAPGARAEILAAAAEVVGQVGYANATVDKIVSAAGMAQGTFYLYFKSRQELFDAILPFAGMEMFSFIGERVRSSRDIFELETRGMMAFFEYMKRNPGFSRIINEAEAAAPRAYLTHLKLLKDRYVKSLSESRARNEFSNFSGEELEVVAYMLMSCRHYLHLRYMKMQPTGSSLEKIVDVYERFIRSGLK